MSVYKLETGKHVITVKVDGLTEGQQINMTVLHVDERTWSNAQLDASEWCDQNLRMSEDHRGLPVADVYAVFEEWCAKNGKMTISKNAFSRLITKKYAQGKMMRHPITGQPCAAYLVKWLKQEPAPSEPDPFETLM